MMSLIRGQSKLDLPIGFLGAEADLPDKTRKMLKQRA